MKKHSKIFLIVILPIILIYFIWGYFGFAGAQIPGSYDAVRKEYKAFWLSKSLRCVNGYCRLSFYVPFKKQGLIDTTGKLTVPFIYDYLRDAYLVNFIRAWKNGKMGIINSSNKLVVPIEYDQDTDDIYYYQDGTIKITKLIGAKKVIKLVDEAGVEILPLSYSDINMPYHSRFPFFIANKGLSSYLVFPDGKEIKKDYFIPITSYGSSTKHLTVRGVKKKDLKQNVWEIKELESTKRPTDGMHFFRINKSKPVKFWYGIYDKNGNEQLQVKYDYIDWLRTDDYSSFIEPELSLVNLNEKFGLYDAQRKRWILSMDFDEISDNIDKDLPLIKARRKGNKKYNYYSLKGNLILSDKLSVEAIDEKSHDLIFHKGNSSYKLKYRKDKEKFIWYKM